MTAHRHPPLRVLVQDCETECFLMFPAAWTEFPSEAFDFQTTTSALEFCRQGHVTGVRTVLQLGNALLDLVDR